MGSGITTEIRITTIMFTQKPVECVAITFTRMLLLRVNAFRSKQRILIETIVRCRRDPDHDPS